MPRKTKIEVENNNPNQVFNLSELKTALDNAEKQIRTAKQLLFGEMYKQKSQTLKSNGSIVEGIFDGVNMVGADGRNYSVPPNYASKSKLVPGDILKLTISQDGSYTFKQISPVERTRVVGRLCENDGVYSVECDGRIYQVLPASVTFFRAKDGDRVTLVVAKNKDCNWGAMDNVTGDK